MMYNFIFIKLNYLLDEPQNYKLLSNKSYLDPNLLKNALLLLPIEFIN